jgi:hypothetical protein
LNDNPVAVALTVHEPSFPFTIELTAGVPVVVTLKDPAVPEATE